MVFLLSELQGRWLASWRPAGWVPALARLHRASQASQRTLAKADAAAALDAAEAALREKRLLRLTREDGGNRVAAEVLAFHGVLQHAYVVALDLRLQASSSEAHEVCLAVDGTAQVCGLPPAWVPLAPVLAAVCFWLPFPAAKSSEAVLTKTMRSLGFAPAAPPPAPASIVSPQSEFFIFFIAVPAACLMLLVLQSGIVGPPPSGEL
uniref:Uncharacterized protein n=1 Tax=Phaeomonas parva TaxID=124430 RepID=A0A6U4EP23_9STRA|mmetsp:Transcript_20816/g.63335  ORF Transcript_20816/g.63335 Transcript_20816/m.63335 type:complete len:207 (+) Transcript_20816:107-727(+)